jgi:hypothetical protein
MSIRFPPYFSGICSETEVSEQVYFKKTEKTPVVRVKQFLRAGPAQGYLARFKAESLP